MGALKRFYGKYSLEVLVSITFTIIMLSFIIASPQVFFNSMIYIAVFSILGMLILLTVSNAFVVICGEIDLSFPSVLGIGAWVFAIVVSKEISPFFALFCAVAVGALAGFLNGILVTKLKLSSLITTLALMYLFRGFLFLVNGNQTITLVFLKETLFANIFVGKVGKIPAQLFWGLGYAIIMGFILNRHKFGGYIGFVGDNPISAREMGINVDRVKIQTFMLASASAAFGGVILALLNNIFRPTLGDGYLMIVLASVFVGGTPTWGGVGTVFGAVLGASIMAFLETGIVAAGLTGYSTQFFFGLIIILSTISHRFSKVKKIS